jgi:hypothetical protein
MKKSERLRQKADKLLKEGDAAMMDGRKAEGKRLLRHCRRLRSLTRIAEADE